MPGRAESKRRVRNKCQTSGHELARIAVTVFPLLVVIAGIAGFLVPGAFKPMGPSVPYLLGIIMFRMGLTLTTPDFASVVKRPWAVVLGIVAHYVIMPGAGWLIAVALNLPPELAVGLILVGCPPSGTASNVMAFLAKGDVALSVAVASVSTLIAPIVTPLLVLFLAGSFLQIDAGAMVLDIVKTVLLPVAAGLVARLFLKKLVAKVLPALPWASAVVISLIVAIVVAGSASKIVAAGGIVFLAVVLHNGFGLAWATWPGSSAAWTTRPAGRWLSKWGCRTPDSLPPLQPRTSVRWPHCPRPCSRSGTTSPARSWPRGWPGARCATHLFAARPATTRNRLAAVVLDEPAGHLLGPL